MRPLHRIAVAVVTVEAVAAAWSFLLLPRLRRWGATDEEASRALPGDDLVDEPVYTTTHAATIGAPVAVVWPWLVQIGQNRGGFYSYDVLENLLRLKIHSADVIHPEWQGLRAGEDYVTLDPDEYMKMTIAVLEPERAFVIRSGAPGEPPQTPGSFFRGELAWSWGFYVEPLDSRTTRLIVRSRAAWRRTAAAVCAQVFGLEPAHFIMEEGMLRGIRDRAERAAHGGDPVATVGG